MESSNLQNTGKKIENGKQKFPVSISQFQRVNLQTFQLANFLTYNFVNVHKEGKGNGKQKIEIPNFHFLIPNSNVPTF